MKIPEINRNIWCGSVLSVTIFFIFKSTSKFHRFTTYKTENEPLYLFECMMISLWQTVWKHRTNSGQYYTSLHTCNVEENWSSETEMERKSNREDILNHRNVEIHLSFQIVCIWLYIGAMNCWSAFLFCHSTIWGGWSRLFQSHSKFTKAGCFSPKKSQSMLLNMIQLSISERFLSALQNKQLFLMPPSFTPSHFPFLSVSVSLSPCHSCSFAGWWEASEGMSKRHLRQVCERHSVISVERHISLRACLWSYPQLGDNRWCRKKENPGKHPGAGRLRGEVTAERQYTEGAEGSSGQVWDGSPTHVQSFKLCFCLSDACTPSLPLPLLSLPPPIILYM